MVCDAEDCKFQMLNGDEIVTSVQEEYDPIDDETDEQEDNHSNESSKDPSNADTFSALETTIQWYEQQSECYPTQLLLLKRIRDLAAKKGRCKMKKRTEVQKPEIEIKMTPHKPRKSATIDYTTDDEDLIMYDVQEEELEPDKFAIKECPQNFPKGYVRALTPTRYSKSRS
ncbi:uncharacterized protein TNCV_2102941 [Trichonephila clavipes]|nr:uncharacterized protein TNCV_2102941 [Trichonephila clavipes]